MSGPDIPICDSRRKNKEYQFCMLRQCDELDRTVRYLRYRPLQVKGYGQEAISPCSDVPELFASRIPFHAAFAHGILKRFPSSCNQFHPARATGCLASGLGVVTLGPDYEAMEAREACNNAGRRAPNEILPIIRL